LDFAVLAGVILTITISWLAVRSARASGAFALRFLQLGLVAVTIVVAAMFVTSAYRPFSVTGDGGVSTNCSSAERASRVQAVGRRLPGWAAQCKSEASHKMHIAFTHVLPLWLAAALLLLLVIHVSKGRSDKRSAGTGNTPKTLPT